MEPFMSAGGPVSEERFAFGRNWLSFNDSVSQRNIVSAMNDICAWLDPRSAEGLRVLDVGSGSGLHSLAFHRLGAASVTSFDYDLQSVEATEGLWKAEGSPATWSVTQGSALDSALMSSLGTFDLVYSWGVLHHTGDMWRALVNVAALVRPGGWLWIALYTHGPHFDAHLRTKRSFHSAGRLKKELMVRRFLLRHRIAEIVRAPSTLLHRPPLDRGMNRRHDAMDWLGGLPYEVASADDIVRFGSKHDLVLRRISSKPEGSCSSYLFERNMP